MKVLLDECIPIPRRKSFLSCKAVTAKYQGFAGLKNGKLLNAAVGAGFNCLVTLDQRIEFEQNVVSLPISVVILHAPQDRFDLLVQLARKFESVCTGFKSGNVYHLQ